MKEKDLKHSLGGFTALGQKVIPDSEDFSDISQYTKNSGDASDAGFSPSSLSEEIRDRSGGGGPFSINRYPQGDGNDDKVVIGRGFKSLETHTLQDGSKQDLHTVPARKGREAFLPGFIFTPAGVVGVKSQTVIDLWNESDADNVITNTDPAVGYQVATLYVDLRGMDPLSGWLSDSWYKWAPLVSGWDWIDSNSNPPPTGSGPSLSDKELLLGGRSDIVILGHVMASTAAPDYPRRFIFAYGQRPEGVIHTGTRGSVVPVYITGVHPDSPGDASTDHMFVGDIYSDGTWSHTPTESGVTVRVMGIAPKISSYPSIYMLGVGIKQQWTGDSGDIHDETVYEVQQFVWWA